MSVNQVDNTKKYGLIIISVIAFIIILRLILTLWWIYSKADGIFMLYGDSCSRSMTGYLWSKTSLLKSFPHGQTWLPLHFFLLAMVFKFIPDLINVPPMLSLFFWSGIIICIYRITKRLFNIEGNSIIALFACIIVSFYPWYFNQHENNWFFFLSISGMSDPIFHFLILFGTMFFLDYIHTEKNKYLLFSSLVFLVSTTIRYETWGIVGVISLILLFKFIKTFKSQPDIYIPLCILIMCEFMPIWLYEQHISRGDPLQFVKWTFEFANTELSFLKRIIFYPFLLFKVDSPIAIISILGMFFVLIKKINFKIIFNYLIVTFGYIFLLICMAAFFGPVGSINRPVALVFLMFIPFCSYAIFIAIKTVFNHKFTRVALLVISIILIFSNIIALNKIENYYGFPAISTIDTGRRISHLYKSGILSDEDNILLELKQGPEMAWDYNALMMFAPDNLFFDRWDTINMAGLLKIDSNPSIFDTKNSRFTKLCKKYNIKYIIFTSENNRKKRQGYVETIYKNEDYELCLFVN
ncbi:hypothetical protein ACFLUV_01255 [Elusimicrobiota bacterium]